jgi:predicted deoxyguanosinetriphosphate triphosphohydrolase
MIMNESAEEIIYSSMQDLVKRAVGQDVFRDIIGQFLEEDKQGEKSSFQLYIENKLFQLKRRNKIVKIYNKLIKKYGHAYESNALNIEKTDSLELAKSGYCIISLCIHGWKHHNVSTNKTVNCLVKIFDYINNPPENETEKEKCIKLAKYIDRIFWTAELPFLPNHNYGRFFISYPDHSKNVWKSLNKDEEEVKLKRIRAIFILLYFELHGSMRPRYARECERIRSSVFFRYSQYKSQVMFNCASDEQRTRLSHTLEIAGVAKTIATQLGCNWELVEAMALGHDLGHVPFGHQGEEQLDKCLHDAWAGRFSHSLQSVKVLNELANHSTLYDRFGITGLCLSRPVLEGVLKHDTDNLFHDIRRAEWRLQYNEWREALIRYNEDGTIEETEWKKGLTIGGLESQIVYWSDKIAYAGHDWDELAHSGYIDQIALSLDIMLKRMHQIRHMIDGIDGVNRENINYTTVQKEIDIICFIRFVIEEMRNRLVTKFNEDSKQEEIENRIFCAFRPWDKNNEANDVIADPVETYKDYPLYHLICGLGYIIKEKIETNKISLKYFTKGEYKQLLDFFSVVYYWVKITGIYPKPYKKSDDLLWVLCRYLTSIDNRIVVQALQVHLIQYSREKILKTKLNKSDLKEDDIYNSCQEMFKNVLFSDDLMEGLPKDIEPKTLRGVCDYVSEYGYIDSTDPANKNKNKRIKQSFKKHLQRQMMISMENEIIDALDNTSDFVRLYYIESPRVRAMKVKAHMIIKNIFVFFMKHEDMLPIEYQQRIEYYKQYLLITKYYNDDDELYKVNKHFLVSQYLQERYIEYQWQHKYKYLRKAATSYIDLPEILTSLKLLLDSSKNKSNRIKMPKRLIELINNYNKNNYSFDEIHSEFCQHIAQARVVADYIACMTDRMAEKKYNEIISSSTTWSTSYHE